jgi:CHAD domain-containing protein
MNKKKVKKKLIKEHKGARRRLQSFIKNGDQEQLHQFRVGIKKLKAVASLVEATADSARLRKDVKLIKETYQLSGRVRDSHLHIKLGTDVSASADYLSEEKLVLKRAVRKLRKGRSYHLKMLRSSKKKMLKHVQGPGNKAINLFYDNEFHAIHLCLNSSEDIEALHDCRKRLKILIYNLPIVKDVLKMYVNEEYLQQVQTAIGDWHDNVLAAEQFPELSKHSKILYKKVKQLVKQFYNKSITKVEAVTKSSI